MNYQEINARHPELAELEPFSADWYRGWRKAHLVMYPDCDQITRDNLNQFVAEAEEREAQKEADHGRS
jgi:hypothetical protein